MRRMNQGEGRPEMPLDGAVGADTDAKAAGSHGLTMLLVLSGALIAIGLSLDVLWGNPVVVVLGDRVLYSGSVGSLVAFAGMMLLLGTGIAAAVRSAR